MILRSTDNMETISEKQEGCSTLAVPILHLSWCHH